MVHAIIHLAHTHNQNQKFASMLPFTPPHSHACFTHTKNTERTKPCERKRWRQRRTDWLLRSVNRSVGARALFVMIHTQHLKHKHEHPYWPGFGEMWRLKSPLMPMLIMYFRSRLVLKSIKRARVIIWQHKLWSRISQPNNTKGSLYCFFFKVIPQLMTKN